MKEVYISLLLIIATAYFIFVSYPRKMARFEGFASMCQKDSDCPRRFKCESGKCADTRPKGN
jgi:hypothetical protein